MPTILHTADVHLDRAFAGAGMTSGIAAVRREELRDAFRRFIDLALEVRADAVTIGGDLYEHERSTLDTGNFLRQQFERLGAVPAFIAPGNHDPVLPDSLWRRVDWPANVTVFTEPRFRAARPPSENGKVLERTGLTIWGAGHDAPDLRTNLLEGFAVPREGTHVLLFHGSDITAVPEGKRVHCGFLPRDVDRTGAGFALLGHYHGARVSERFAYPGSPEALDFGESGQHYVLKLEIDERGARPELVPFGRVSYVTHRLDVTGVTTSDELRAGIVALGDREAIVRAVLEGELNPDVDLDVPALYNACAERFRFLDLIDRTRPGWRLDEIAEESTTKGAFVRLLQARAESSPGDEAEVVRLALALGLQAFDRREVRVP